MSGRNPCNSGRYGDSGSPGICPDGIRASLGDSGSPLDPSCKRGRFAPPGRRARGWTPFECRNLGFPDPRPNGICASAGVSGVLPRAEFVQVWAGRSRSPDLSGRTAEFGARRSSSGRNSCMGHSRSCDTDRERAGVQKYPCPSGRGGGHRPSAGDLGLSGPSERYLCKCGRSAVRPGVTGRRVCGVLLFLRMDVVQVQGTWGSQVRPDEIRASVGASGSPGSYGRNSCTRGSPGVPRLSRWGACW